MKCSPRMRRDSDLMTVNIAECAEAAAAFPLTQLTRRAKYGIRDNGALLSVVQGYASSWARHYVGLSVAVSRRHSPSVKTQSDNSTAHLICCR